MFSYTRNVLAVAMAAIVVVNAATISLAATLDWDNGGGDNKWSTALNWNPNTVPAPIDTVRYNINIPTPILVDGSFTFANLLMADKSVAGNVDDTVTWQASGPVSAITITTDVVIGRQGSSAVNPNFLRGTLISNGVDLTIGSSSSRATMSLGNKTVGGNSGTRGVIDVNNASFTAWLTTLDLGGQRTITNGSANGLLDLSGATSVLLDVSGHVNLGYSAVNGNTTQFLTGTLNVANGEVNVGGNVHLARYSTEGGPGGQAGRGTNGTLTLTNTPMTVAGQVIFGGRREPTFPNEAFNLSRARVFVNVDGKYSGLDVQTNTNGILFSSASSVDLVGNYNLIDIKFLSDPDGWDTTSFDSDRWYWGLRWVGDHEAFLESLLLGVDPRLLIDDSGLSAYWKLATDADYITYNAATGYTYIGFYVPLPAPEPSMLTLLACGMLVLSKRSRQRARN